MYRQRSLRDERYSIRIRTSSKEANVPLLFGERHFRYLDFEGILTTFHPFEQQYLPLGLSGRSVSIFCLPLGPVEEISHSVNWTQSALRSRSGDTDWPIRHSTLTPPASASTVNSSPALPHAGPVEVQSSSSTLRFAAALAPPCVEYERAIPRRYQGRTTEELKGPGELSQCGMRRGWTPHCFGAVVSYVGSVCCVVLSLL
jgi:hypothetical protein